MSFTETFTSTPPSRRPRTARRYWSQVSRACSIRVMNSPSTSTVVPHPSAERSRAFATASPRVSPAM